MLWRDAITIVPKIKQKELSFTECYTNTQWVLKLRNQSDTQKKDIPGKIWQRNYIQPQINPLLRERLSCLEETSHRALLCDLGDWGRALNKQNCKCIYICACWGSIPKPLRSHNFILWLRACGTFCEKSAKRIKPENQKTLSPASSDFAKIAQPRNREFRVEEAWRTVPQQAKTSGSPVRRSAHFSQVSGHLPCLLLLEIPSCSTAFDICGCPFFGTMKMILS